MKKKLETNMSKIKYILNIGIIGKYRGAVNSICNLKNRVPKKISIAFHNVSNYIIIFS